MWIGGNRLVKGRQRKERGSIQNRGGGGKEMWRGGNRLVKGK